MLAWVSSMLHTDSGGTSNILAFCGFMHQVVLLETHTA